MSAVREIQQAFSSLPPAEQEALKKTVEIIETHCEKNTDRCADFNYHWAWETLVQAQPSIGLKLLSLPQYPWPVQPYEFASRKVPEGLNISKELWNRILAFRWVLQRLEGEARRRFLEETLAKEKNEGLIFVETADFSLSKPSQDEKAILENARLNFKPTDSDGSKQKLANEVREMLWLEVELREALSPKGPIP